MVILPFWPAYTEAIAQSDANWIYGAIRRLVFVTIIGVGGGVILLTVFGNWLITLWVGPHYQVPTFLFIGIGATTLLLSFNSIFSTFLNALNKLKVQVLIVWSAILVTLALKIMVGHSYGLIAMVWTGVFGFLFLNIMPHTLYALHVLKTHSVFRGAGSHRIRDEFSDDAR
jgi:O-antigen/teichoic acid export membrane protein